MPVLMFIAGRPVRGQSANEQSAYVALYYTPVAGLPPLAPSIDTSSRRSGSAFVLQGRMGEMSRRNGLDLKTMGVGVEVPRGHWNFGGTLAYIAATCGPEWADDSDCAGDIMLGATVRRTLLSRPLGDNPAPIKGKRSSQSSNDERLLVGFEGSAGFSPRQGEQALALAASVPVAIAIRNGDLRILPFDAGHWLWSSRRLYEGMISDVHGSLAPMVGGGLELQFESPALVQRSRSEGIEVRRRHDADRAGHDVAGTHLEPLTLDESSSHATRDDAEPAAWRGGA
jgi:hypothetical protein